LLQWNYLISSSGENCLPEEIFFEALKYIDGNQTEINQENVAEMAASRTSIQRFLPWKRHLHEQMDDSKMSPFRINVSS
jgi:hypothetical protein